MRIAHVFTLACLAALPACVGRIGDAPPGPSTKPPEEAAFVPAEATLHRLSRAQYQNAVRDLFGPYVGPDFVVPTDLEADTMLHGSSAVAASELTISPLAAEQYEAAAYAVVDQVFSDEHAAAREALLGCSPSSAADPCVRAFFVDFGMRVFRRPLTATEVAEHTALAEALAAKLASPWLGIEFTVAAMLQSPHFLFRVEQGDPDPKDPSRLILNGWEIASRLSFLLRDSTPDDALIAAAERGDLDTPEGIRNEAERLLAAPRARDAMTRFFSEFLNLQRLDDLTKNVAVYPQMTPTLGASMKGEIERMFLHVAFEQDGDFRAIFNARETYVNAELAALYGLPTPEGEGYRLIPLPDDSQRGGLLGTAGILALYAHNTVTSPTLRGKFVRMNLLCQDIPPPPPGVAASLGEDQGGAATPQTMRQKLEKHRTNPACASCHEKMDPIGLGLEHFDAIGAFRETDQGLPIDTTSELDGVKFDGARELGELLARSPEVGACVARRFYRHGVGHLEGRDEEPAIQDLAKRFADSGYRFQELVIELVQSPAFRVVSRPAATKE